MVQPLEGYGALCGRGQQRESRVFLRGGGAPVSGALVPRAGGNLHGRVARGASHTVRLHPNLLLGLDEQRQRQVTCNVGPLVPGRKTPGGE